VLFRRIVWETVLSPEVPLLIMPTTFHAGIQTKFSLMVSGVSLNQGLVDFRKIEHDYEVLSLIFLALLLTLFISRS